MEQPWDFYYRSYPKNRAIQLKPVNDKTVHFSIVWTKTGLSLEDFNAIDNRIREFLTKKKWSIGFKIVKACENCTYGHMDDDFEKLLLELREQYPDICVDKNLPLVGQHEHLKKMTHEPVFLHVSHSRSNSEQFNDFMSKGKFGRTMTMNITVKE
jgi:hypothetical protein